MFRHHVPSRFLLLAVCLATTLTIATAITPVKAASYDDTYTYSYQYEWDGSWSTNNLGEVFIVSSGGDISILGSGAFYGGVYSFGGVTFYGPSPMGGEQATFTGTISSDGSGDGTWSAPSGVHGYWYVERVNGGSFEIGGNPVSWSIAIVVGLIVFSIIGYTYKHTSSKRKRQIAQTQSAGEKSQINGSSAQPLAPQPPKSTYAAGWASAPADNSPPPPPPLNPINGGSGYHLEDHGVVSHATPELSSLPFLNAQWLPGQASLTWGRAQFDPSKYRLLQFDVSQVTYGPNNTVPQPTNQTVVADDGSAQFTQNRFYAQTYNHSTGGDVSGFRVDPLFQDLNTGHTFHSGGLGVKIGQGVGSYGIGPGIV